jgi:hypothetical protein
MVYILLYYLHYEKAYYTHNDFGNADLGGLQPSRSIIR